MDSPKKLTENCPPGTPLHQVSPERVNQQKQWDLPTSPTGENGSKASKHSRDSSVNDKIAQFNSLAYQGKQLERKTNDAALKRAMVGREEAETEMRRYRDEARILRRQVEEGKERERKVGERLENVMVCYQYAHHVEYLLTPHLIGKLWTSQRNTFTHTSIMGKRNSESSKRRFQITICRCQDSRRTQSFQRYIKNGSRWFRTGKESKCKERTRSIFSKTSTCYSARRIDTITRKDQVGGTGKRCI